MTNVPWIGGRRKALARAMAIHQAGVEGHDWCSLNQAKRDARVEEFDRLISRWVTDGVLVQFVHEYREHENEGSQGGELDKIDSAHRKVQSRAHGG